MLFNEDFKANELFNIEHKDIEILNPQEGFTIGNMFFDLYVPYKHHKPGEVMADNDKDRLLLKLQELSFAINDLNLYLDVYPHDERVFRLFKEYNTELKNVSENYVAKYGPLTIDDDMENSFKWVNGPWPWEGHNV